MGGKRLVDSEAKTMIWPFSEIEGSKLPRSGEATPWLKLLGSTLPAPLTRVSGESTAPPETVAR